MLTPFSPAIYFKYTPAVWLPSNLDSFAKKLAGIQTIV